VTGASRLMGFFIHELNYLPNTTRSPNYVDYFSNWFHSFIVLANLIRDQFEK
jgi:hypothetical protein